MQILLNCPHCEGQAVFAPSRGASHGRLLGNCDSCRSVFSLYGGRLTTIDSRVPEPPTRHALTSLVARARRTTLAD
jgi:hypothetical protein